MPNLLHKERDLIIMKPTHKSYFVRSFMLAKIILMIASTALLLSGVLFLLIAYVEHTITAPSHLTLVVETSVKGLYQWLAEFGLIIFSPSIALLLIEVISRLRHDSLSNFWRSICLTLSFQRFLHQRERNEISLDKQTKQAMNPILKDFNKAARRCVIDITNKQTIAFIKVPQSQQAHKILKEMTEQIKEELSSHNPQYYFSAPERIKNTLWYIGTKRD